jgi:hypothetical protein
MKSEVRNLCWTKSKLERQHHSPTLGTLTLHIVLCMLWFLHQNDSSHISDAHTESLLKSNSTVPVENLLEYSMTIPWQPQSVSRSSWSVRLIQGLWLVALQSFSKFHCLHHILHVRPYTPMKEAFSMAVSDKMSLRQLGYNTKECKPIEQFQVLNQQKMVS